MYNGIKPIDLAFGEDSSHIDIKDGVTKGSCSDYVPPPVVVEPITTTPAAPTTIDPLHKALTFPPWDVEDADTVYLESENPEIGALESDGSLATVVVVILVVVFVVLLLAIVVTVHKMNKKDEKRKAAGYDKIPMKDIENGFGQPGQDQRPVEPPRTTEPPPPKPPHRNFRKLSEEESVPLKDAIVADSESSIADSEDDRLPIQPKDEELEWDPAGDITIVPDDPEHSPRPAGQPPTDPETSKGSEEHVQLHQQPIEMIDKESEPEPEAEKESEAEPEDDPKPEPEPEPEPEPDEVQLIQLEDDPEADLEWDDELSPEEQLMPHERLVSLEDSQLQDKPDEESEEEKTTETTPLHIEEDEDTPPLIPSKDEVKYTPLENEPDDDEVDHRAPPTHPEQNSVDPEVEPVAEPEVESVAEPEEEPVAEPEEEEMVQADALEHLPPEHVSKQAELKTQEGIPEDVFVNDDDHTNQSLEDDDVMPGEPAETADDHEVLTTPQRKKKKTRTSRRGSSISAQSSERV
ncbi:proline-, glutamic acid- and leucine-rich protein 1-like isoform X2 [Ptychodera flava]|uniref:proline-, glutamic acid- and leucine-rich protein 1-like isoform X2 n=1 Tax=Ptychodera flava TaxID=63121 RepID=UPI00396A9AF0